MPDDGGLRRSRFGPSTSTALSPVVIDVGRPRRGPGLLSLLWVAVLAAAVGFVVASLAVGIRRGVDAPGIARLWLPAPVAEPPAPIALADVVLPSTAQELPEPERVEPPPVAVVVVEPPKGPIGPLGEPLPDPAQFAAADALPVIAFPADLPADPPQPSEFEKWIGRLTGRDLSAAAPAPRPAPPRAAASRPPAATPPTQTAAAQPAPPAPAAAPPAPPRAAAPPPAFRAGLPPAVAASPETAEATPAGGNTARGLPPLPAARAVSRSVPVPPQPPGTQVAAAVPAARVMAWTRHARPFDASEQRPRIAIVVTELGLSQAMTDQAIQFLPGAVTLAFNPYAEALDRWIESARAAGHEVLINLPMEPANFPANDPGPQALLTGVPAAQNLARLDWVLGRVDGIVGVAGIHGGRFVANAQAMQPVMASLRERGVIYVEKTVGTPSTGPRLARELGVPRAMADRWIDVDPSRAGIDQRLADIERVAREFGVALAVAQPLPVTYERLAIWQTTLQAKSLVLAPVSAVIDRQRDR